MINKRLVWLLLVIFSFHASLKAQQSVLTQHNDNSRTGWNNQEVLLNTGNVRAGSFGKIFSRTVDDEIYAQPLVVLNVNIPSVGVKNVVYVATTNNTVYAFDADSANVTTPYWQVNLTPANSRPTNVNTDLAGACGGNYHDFSNNVGIVGTPVIDAATNTIFLVSRCFNTAGGGFQQWIHALDIRTGAERPNSPRLIRASINSFGSGNVAGVLKFDSLRENQRSGFIVDARYSLYRWAGHCDWPPYHGWIMGYDKTSLQQKTVYCTTPLDGGGGIWMSANGLSADNNGNIFAASGNGYMFLGGGSPATITNRSTSALKLVPNASGGLSLGSYFTPYNFAQLDSADLDFGPGGMLLLPNTNQVVTNCKDGKIFLLDRDNMGGIGVGTNNVLQTIDLGINAHLRASLAYYKGTAKEYVYSWSENSLLKAFPYNRATHLFDLPQTVSSGVQGPTGNNGAFISISSNGSIDSTAILWANYSVNGDANHAVRPGILRAFSAIDVTKELWNSNQFDPNNPGDYAKFTCPTVSNGKVYLATFSDQLVVYGLNAGNTLDTCTSSNLALNKPTTASSIENATYPPTQATDGLISTRWSSMFADPQWITVDLGGRYDLCKMALHWETAMGKNFTVQLSDDNATWTTVQTFTNNATANNFFTLSSSGRYVRVFGTSRVTPYGYSLFEIEVFGRPSASNCPTPTNLDATFLAETGATLSWDANGLTNFVVEYKTVSDVDWQQKVVTTNNTRINGLACSSDYLYRVRGVCSVGDSSVFSANNSFSTLACTGGCGPLPSRWTTQDIGSVALAGLACYSNGAFTLHGSGADIGGTADQFHFAYSSLDADGDFIARVADMDNSNGLNKLGIMIREDLSAGSRNVFVGLSSGNGLVFQSRSNPGGATNVFTSGPGITEPYWVRLNKVGNLYTAFSSTDGITWVQIGSPVNAGFGMSESVFSGLAITSHNNAVISIGSIDNFQFTASETLPLKLRSFNAGLKPNRTVGITWTTVFEEDVRSFVVERSADGVHFEEIFQMLPMNEGFSIETYNVVDRQPLTGLNFYRLKMIDKDGSLSYSQVVLVRISAAAAPLMFPNPARSTVHITAGTDPIKAIAIYDMSGRIMKWIKVGGVNSLDVPLHTLANGLYFVKIITAGSEYQQRLMVRN